MRAEETCQYLPGTRDRLFCIRAGERTDYSYDYRGRMIGTTVYPRDGVQLTSQNVYLQQRLFCQVDRYGRRTYFAYRASDGALIRKVQATVPLDPAPDPDPNGGNPPGYNAPESTTEPTYYAAVLGLVRGVDPEPNGKFLITDYVYDAGGNLIETIDPRGIHHTISYDSRDRAVMQIAAAGTPVAATTETIYDPHGNVVEVRSPRYFDAADTSGHQKARTTFVYTGRNLLASRTEAPGTAEAATESLVYTLDGRLDTRTDVRGNNWQTLWSACCANRQSATLNLNTFTGRRRDEETGLNYFRARLYASLLGRFVGRDPIVYKGSEWSLYEYVASSPLQELDASGLALGGGKPWEYGKYCGPKLAAVCVPLPGGGFTPALPPVNPPPDDALDAACMIHDCCLARPWEVFQEYCLGTTFCNWAFCTAMDAIDCGLLYPNDAQKQYK